MPRFVRWIVVIAAVVAAVWLLRVTVFRAKPVRVEVAVAERGVVEDTVTNSQAATVKTRLRARVGAEVGGRVAAIPHREGSAVSRGDLLVALDDATARRQLELTRKELSTARATRDAAVAAARLAASELARAESLGRQGLISTEQLDAARSNADRTAAEEAAAAARIESAEAALRVADQALANHQIRAPFDGVVAELLAELGESVLPGTPLVELLDPDQLYVSAELDEVDIGRVEKGLPARVEFDPFPGVSLPGTVARVAPYVSDLLEQNRTLEVEVEYRREPGDPNPRPGTSADVEIILDHREDVLRVPSFAVIEGNHVLVVENGRAERRDVEIGLRNWDFTEIVGGLDEGTSVITSLDRVQLEPGMRVEVDG